MKAAVRKIEEILNIKGTKLPARETTPMSSDYRPELDATEELDANGINMFQELI